MLQSEQAVEDEGGDLDSGRIDAEDSARAFHFLHCDIESVWTVRTPDLTGRTGGGRSAPGRRSLGPVIDLHCHSTCSDGSETAGFAVVELAIAAASSAVALTDHDGFAGLAEAGGRARSSAVTFVPGCEVSCTFQPGSMHVLCYFVGDGTGPLTTALAALREDRAARNDALIDRLAEIGIPVGRSEVEDEAGSSVIGRPHFAAVLVRHGVVDSVEEAFDRYLAKGKPGYVEREDIAADDAIALTRASGGVAVLAHPLSLGPRGQASFARLPRTPRRLGPRRMECEYAKLRPDDSPRPSSPQAHPPPRGDRWLSDFHGRYTPGLFVGTGRGDLSVPDEALRLAHRSKTQLKNSPSSAKPSVALVSAGTVGQVRPLPLSRRTRPVTTDTPPSTPGGVKDTAEPTSST